MEFEWDPAKEAVNEEKHGIGFVDAMDVFEDLRRFEVDMTKSEHGEQRRRVIGRMGSIVVTVIYTDRQGRRRLISAQRASRDERTRYGQS